MAQYKVSEWQDITKKWYVNCVDNLVGKAGLWWIPCRILNLAPVDFILLLKNKFNASHFIYKNDVLIYSWDNYSDAHRWLLYINKIAKEKRITLDMIG